MTSSLTVLHSARVGLFAHIFCTDKKRLFPLSAKSHSGKSELYWTALKLRCDWLGAGPGCRLVNCMRAPSTGDTFTWQREWHNTTLFKIIRKHQNTSYLRIWLVIPSFVHWRINSNLSLPFFVVVFWFFLLVYLKYYCFGEPTKAVDRQGGGQGWFVTERQQQEWKGRFRR